MIVIIISPQTTWKKYKHQFVKMMSRRIVFEVSNGQEVEGGLPLPGESDSVILM